MKKTNKLYFLALIVVASTLGYCFFGGAQDIDKLKDSVAPTASLYPEAQTISERLEFINDQSAKIDLSQLSKGRWVLLYFGFTSCPDVCPIDLAKISQSYIMMQNKESLQVVFISVDPMRDIGKLDSFAQAFDKSFVGLTAHEQKLASVAKALGVYHQVVETQLDAQHDHSEHDHSEHKKGSNGDDMGSKDEMKSMSNKQYNVDHTASFLLLSPDLKLTALLTSPHEPKAMAQALDKIIDAL